MPIPRVKSWVPGEVLTANDLNNEFNNLANTALIEPFVANQPIDLNGQLLILDADGDTLIDASTNDTIDITIGGNDDFRFTVNTFTALAGSNIVLDDGDITLSDGNVVLSNGRVLEADGGDVFSASAITVPTTGHTFTMTGTTPVVSFSTTQVGVMFYVRFTGAGLNITHNAVSMIAPWGVDYRTVPNEVICFLSLGGGNYTFWSMNGPKEQTGQTMTDNSSTALAGGLLEDGTAYSRTTYSGLFAKIGTVHGAGNGSTTFNVPDSRGRVDINVDGTADRITVSSINGHLADTLGGAGGAETHVLDANQMPSHTHVESFDSGAVGTGTGIAQTTNAAEVASASSTQATGGGAAHSNTPPWIAKYKYIRF